MSHRGVTGLALGAMLSLSALRVQRNFAPR